MELSGKRILVTGVTGTLGLRVAKRLLPEALEVRGLIRNAERFTEFESIGITPVLGDLTDQTSLEKAMDQMDWVVHCAAYLGDDENLAHQSNVEGVIHLATAALDAGARVLHISTTSVYGEPADGHMKESSPLAVDHPAPYIQTKIRSEQILNEYATRGLDVRILRPGAICAEHDSHWGDRQVRRMQEADTVTWVHPDDLVNWVHAENIAEMVVLVLTRGQPGDVYHAVDANIPETDFRMRMIEASGKPYQVPNRAAERPTYATDKIRTLGYRSVRSFEETMVRLVYLFQSPV
ncbi:epimerase [Exiguobacterium sp. KRL4]|uniref:NAD-dependent epimerase/dehydratase family protein n=1 Tax=Exiguobacterium sp. KRL4 TaxID=1914536 RepID=UPI0008F8A101|nr:NAD-dependent epimerase/dehydratase family protein [Exiguobacterium sp. KRL4]OIN66653.1 epimerase [Exiguobacterium sp. KRL4]